MSTTGSLTPYGRPFDVTLDYVDMTKVDGYENIIKPGYTEKCILLEMPVSVLKDGVHDILNPADKLAPYIEAAKAKWVYCATIKDIDVEEKDTLRLMISTLPPSPILEDPSKSLELVQASQSAMDWLKKAFFSQLKRNSKNPALLKKVCGEKFRCTKTSSNHNPKKYKEDINYWNKEVAKKGGFTYEEILAFLPTKESRERFPVEISLNIKRKSFDAFFERIQEWAQRQSR